MSGHRVQRVWCVSLTPDTKACITVHPEGPTCGGPVLLMAET